MKRGLRVEPDWPVSQLRENASMSLNGSKRSTAVTSYVALEPTTLAGSLVELCTDKISTL